MSPTLTTFLFEAANFLVLAVVLGWVFFKPVRQALADYRAKLDAATKESNQKLSQAEQMRAELDVERKALRDELNKLRTQTLDTARLEAERLVAQARQQAQRVKEAADQHTVKLAEREMASLARAIASTSGAVVGRLLAQLNGVDLDAALIRAACDQIRGMKLNGLTVTVETPEPLDHIQRAMLDEVLGTAADTAIRRVVPELGSGIRVTTLKGLVDCSIAGLAEFAQRKIAQELERQSPKGTGSGE